jgi:hypothetical protein
LTSPPPRLLQLVVAAKDQQQFDRFGNGLKTAGLLPNQDVEICIASNRPDLGTDLDVDSLLTMPEDSSVFQLWAAALQAGTARYVALMDAGCPPTVGWWNRAQIAIEAGESIFFGSVIPGWPKGDRRLAGYIIEYAQFNEPLRALLTEYPGNNIVFQRSLLKADDYPVDGFRKTFFVNRLLAEGGPRPCPVNEMSVSYMKPFNAADYMRRRYAHGRGFGATCSVGLGAMRIWYAVRCLALPILRILRIFRAVRPDKTLIRSTIGLTGYIVISELAWSLGEGTGYLLGPTKSAQSLD